MPCSRGDLSLTVPASFLTWDTSDQSLQHQRVHIGGLVEDVHSVWLCNLTLSSVGGVVGGVLHMLKQNRHYNEHHSRDSAAAQCLFRIGQPTDDLMSPPVDLWGWAMMLNESWLWPEAGMLGRVAWEQCLWGRHRWWDSKIYDIFKNETNSRSCAAPPKFQVKILCSHLMSWKHCVVNYVS